MRNLVGISFVVFMFLSLEAIELGFLDFHFNYIFIFLSLPLLIYRFQTIDSWLVLILAILTVNGLVNVFLGNNDITSLIKSMAGVSFAYWFYFLVVKYNDFNLDKLFRLYYKFAVWTAVIGLVQFFSFLVGFKYGYDLSWLGFRVMGISDLGGKALYPIHSITGEPSSFALLMSPALYISICKITKTGITYGSIKEAIIIIASYLLSQSSTGYFAIFVCILILNLNKISLKSIIIAVFTLPGSFLLLYTTSPKFQDRLDSSLGLFTGEIVLEASSPQRSNGSSLILFNHFIIAYRNASEHPLGTGIGSHHKAFEKYNTLHTWFTGYGKHSMLLNIHDASSLFNRILSEMGYLGIFFAFLFLYKNFMRNDNEANNLVIINHSSLVILCTALLRSGHYFVYGLPFFIFCYYYSAKFNKTLTHDCS